MTSYSLVQVSDTVDFIAIVSFQVNMLLQILPYCYYGNEIIEKVCNNQQTCLFENVLKLYYSRVTNCQNHFICHDGKIAL